MSYRIEYDAPKQRAARKKERLFQKIGAGLLAALLFLGIMLPGGRQTLRDLILPGDPVVMTAALEELTLRLRSGSSLAESLELFCQRVWEGAELDAS